MALREGAATQPAANGAAAANARPFVTIFLTDGQPTIGQTREDPIVQIVKDSGLLYSPNFSIGVNMAFRLVAAAAEMMNSATAYDAWIHEWHHRQKADSPSGTALKLAEILLAKIDRKKRIETARVDGKIDPSALHVSSTRVGAVPGTHIVGFESDADSIEIKHVAKTRRGFALGAIRAAQWLKGRKGVYTMDDVQL